MRLTSSEAYAGGPPPQLEGSGAGNTTSNRLQKSVPSFAQTMLLSATTDPYADGQTGWTVPLVPATGVWKKKSFRKAVQVIVLSTTVPPTVVGQTGCVLPLVPPDVRD